MTMADACVEQFRRDLKREMSELISLYNLTNCGCDRNPYESDSERILFLESRVLMYARHLAKLTRAGRVR